MSKSSVVLKITKGEYFEKIKNSSNKRFIAKAYLLGRISQRILLDKNWKPREHRNEIMNVQAQLVNETGVEFESGDLDEIINSFDIREPNNDSAKKIVEEFNIDETSVKRLETLIFSPNYFNSTKFDKAFEECNKIKKYTPSLVKLRNKICSQEADNESVWYGFFNLGRLLFGIPKWVQPEEWDLLQTKKMIIFSIKYFNVTYLKTFGSKFLFNEGGENYQKVVEAINENNIDPYVFDTLHSEIIEELIEIREKINKCLI